MNSLIVANPGIRKEKSRVSSYTAAALRRAAFSPHAQEVRCVMEGEILPVIIHYRIHEENEAWEAEVPDFGIRCQVGGPRRESAEEVAQYILKSEIQAHCERIISGAVEAAPAHGVLAVQIKTRGFVLNDLSVFSSFGRAA